MHISCNTHLTCNSHISSIIITLLSVLYYYCKCISCSSLYGIGKSLRNIPKISLAFALFDLKTPSRHHAQTLELSPSLSFCQKFNSCNCDSVKMILYSNNCTTLLRLPYILPLYAVFLTLILTPWVDVLLYIAAVTL